MEWILENPRAFQRQHMPHMGPISGVVCKGFFCTWHAGTRADHDHICLARYGHKPDIMRFDAALANEGAIMA